MDYREIVSNPNNLYDALLKSIEGSKWKESSQRKAIFFLDLIFNLSHDLYNNKYKSGKETKFTLHERGKVRAITSIGVRDRIVRHVLCDLIFMPFVKKKIIYDNGASVEGRGISFSRNRFETHIHRYCAKYGTNKGYILFGDYSKFYDNILHDKAKKMLLDLVEHDRFIARLLDIIFQRFEINADNMSDEEYNEAVYGVYNSLDHDRFLPDGDKTIKKSINIGDQLAQIIGVYYLHTIDNYIKIVEQEKYYGRYMDDWYIISPSKERLKELLREIDRQSLELGLHINYKKTTIVPLDRDFTYLQVCYSVTETGKIYKRINPKRVIAMRRRLKKLAIKVENNLVEYKDVENMFKSWMGGFHKLMSRQQRDNLINLYEDLFDCTISVVKGKMIIERICDECAF